MATKWEDLRDDIIRREIRDEVQASYVFTNAELLTYYGNAIRDYSTQIPREVIGSISGVGGQAEYDLPDACLELVEIGDGEYTVLDVFANKMELDPTPSVTGSIELKYRAVHSIPTTDSGTSSYDTSDEGLIVKNVKAQCCEVLAMDGAKYYRYVEGDITEEQGKTQQQFRDEATALYQEFWDGVAKSKETKSALSASVITGIPIATKISRQEPERQASIFKTI